MTIEDEKDKDKKPIKKYRLGGFGFGGIGMKKTFSIQKNVNFEETESKFPKIYLEENVGGFGVGAFGGIVVNQPLKIRKINQEILENLPDSGILIKTNTGIKIKTIDTRAYLNPVHSFKFEKTRRGCGDAELELVEYPDYDLQAFSIFQFFKFGNKNFYTVYLESVPSEFGTQKKTIKLKLKKTFQSLK